jgi:hypothetical protein
VNIEWTGQSRVWFRTRDKRWLFPGFPTVCGLRHEYLFTGPVIPGNIYPQRVFRPGRGDAEIRLASPQTAKVRRFIQKHWFGPSPTINRGVRVVNTRRIVGITLRTKEGHVQSPARVHGCGKRRRSWRYQTPSTPGAIIVDFFIFYVTDEHSAFRFNPKGENTLVRTCYEQWIRAGIIRQLKRIRGLIGVRHLEQSIQVCQLRCAPLIAIQL